MNETLPHTGAEIKKKNNYIINLQNECAQLKNQIYAARSEMRSFVTHLNSAKFQGVEQNGTGAGDRKDWISTGDVLSRLQDIDAELLIN